MRQHCGTCGNCGMKKSDHFNRDCPYQRGICHFCRSGIHNKADCPVKRQWDMLLRIFPMLTTSNASGVDVIRMFSNNAQDWDWSGKYTSSDMIYTHWPNHIVGRIADNMENKMSEFNTNDSLVNVVENTVILYNKMISRRDGRYINWFNLMSRILYIKRQLEH